MTPAHLCCGNFGRLELLLAAVRPETPERWLDVRRHARWLVQRSRSAGGYRLIGSTTLDAHSPGLFRGLSGIGLTLLRIARPGGLPAPLILDVPLERAPG